VEVSETGDRVLYIFRSNNNELLVSRNGEVTSCNWEYLGYADALLVEVDGNRRLYQQGFVDQAVMVLRLDGQKEFLTLVNENKIEETEPKKVQRWIEKKYLSPPRTDEETIEEADTAEDVEVEYLTSDDDQEGDGKDSSATVQESSLEESRELRKNRDAFIFWIVMFLIMLLGAIAIFREGEFPAV